MRHVDALSRLSCLIIGDPLRYRIKEAQIRDDWTKAVRKVLETSPYEDYYVKLDILYEDLNKELMVVSESMEKEIIQIAHRQGHFAPRKTRELIEKSFFIPGLAAKVENIVRGCVECITAEAKKGRKEGLLNPIDKADRPLVTYHIDHVGPMENTHKKYNHILVVIDAFSKFVWLYPTKSTGTDEVVDRLTKQAAIFGNPARIITDRGVAFTSNNFKKFCEIENIHHLLIATGVPRGNGQVERVHKTIIPMLTKLCLEKPDNWYKHIDRVQRILNNTPPRSTCVTPFKLLTGLDMRHSEDTDLRLLVNDLWIQELDDERDKLREDARENILRIQQENRKTFNRERVADTNYTVGELVAIKRTQFGAGMKLRPKFLGLYRVLHGRYDVEKVGRCEGPNKTTTVTEHMKRWESHKSRHT